jgi:hypothetical protein
MTPEMISWTLAATATIASSAVVGIRVVYTRNTKKQDALEERIEKSDAQIRLDLRECKESHAECLEKGEKLTFDLVEVSGRVERLEGWMEGREAGKNEIKDNE